MKNKKVLIIIISSILIVAAGIVYSLEAKKDSSNQVTLIGNLNKNEEVDQISANSKQLPQNSITNQIEDTNESDESKDTLDQKGYNDSGKSTDSSSSSDKKDALNYIHICGQVKNPGVYKVESGARAIDVIELAGGLTGKASGDSVNQAELVTDGEKIYIPSKEEVKNSLQYADNSASQSDKNSITSNSNAIDNSNDNSKGANPSSKLVNINSATKEELLDLPGIGESKANNIIKYREENGAFRSIEDIKNITGIKDGVFNKIKDFITI
ncbi:helix-hairpin-helix domain-containing protein [Anaeromicropila herbilytica]|uniref:Helix-hairpin-helix DNA-binding motif class 1 domain-containing protein n=1 Tax=Anaeromicropila herbilytica TaxID=2785025 RepID=A0A7R7EMY1_9FIRM|nr:helix-hairpin-helix domain-containing protein [Anaeromicropila herbilytica]BCN31752.1 hypothetical protein bsdtb5_30470 [Anaeromicropila herbilytica]